MSKICYESHTFSTSSEDVISKANKILESYAAQGYDLTLRQLYYQFVSRGFIANKDTEYKKLGSIVNDARMAGRIDWDYITDRTRNMRQNAHWDSPHSIIEACAGQYLIDKWRDQGNYVEVWVEKDALVGVLEVACKPIDVPYFSCRGYTSQSEMWSAGQRLLKQLRGGKKVTIIHLGDHDPSGIDMSRDIEHRISVFVEHHLIQDHAKAHPRALGEEIDAYVDSLQRSYRPTKFYLSRIALNMDQIREYNPPPNPAKITDSRAKQYIAEYGDESWELDALEPAVLTELIQSSVRELLDGEKWEAAEAEEARQRRSLEKCAERWTEVEKLLGT